MNKKTPRTDASQKEPFKMELNQMSTMTSDPETEPFVPEIIALDDDPIFGQVIRRYAKRLNINLTVCGTVSEFARMVSDNKYNAAIIDYYLDECTGTEVANAVRDLPVVLVSRKSQWQKDDFNWPNAVRKFVHKKFGALAILEAAIELIR